MQFLRGRTFQRTVQCRGKIYDKIMNWALRDGKEKRNEMQELPRSELPDNGINLPPVNTRQDESQFAETQEQIGDLERLRMQKLDQRLGTNTVFHESQVYEERIDSEHIMTRRVLKSKEMIREHEMTMQSLFVRDPQTKIQTPFIPNMHKFQSGLQDIVQYPQHERQLNKGYDYYTQLKEEEDGVTNDISHFIMQEHIYTHMTFVPLNRIIDLNRQDYQRMTDAHNYAPIMFDQHTYSFKDPNQGYPYHNIHLNDDQLIITGQQVATILNSPELLQDLQLIPSLYSLILPNHDHTVVGFQLTSGNTIILKHKQQNQWLHLQTINHAASTFAFHQSDCYYIQISDLELQKGVYNQSGTLIYPFDIGQTGDIFTPFPGQLYLNLYQLNQEENAIIDLKTLKTLLPTQPACIYHLDANSQQICYIKLHKHQPTYHIYDINHNIVHNADQHINSFVLLENHLCVLHHKSIQFISQSHSHLFTIQEPQFTIKLDQNQLKQSSFLYFTLITPYKPLQILKYNINVKSVEIHYQEQLVGYDGNLIAVESIEINNHKLTFFFNQTLYNTQDREDNQSLSPEEMILLNYGCILTKINVYDFDSITELLQYLEQSIEEIKKIQLASSFSLKAIGALSGFCGLSLKLKGLLDVVSCHNGIYDYASLISQGTRVNKLVQNEENLAQIQPYQLVEKPVQHKIRNLFLSTEQNHRNAYQTRKMVAQLRENLKNNVDIKYELGLNFKEFEPIMNDAEIKIDHVSYMIYAMSK